MTNIEKINQLEIVKEKRKEELEKIRREENPCHYMTRITIKDLELEIEVYEKEINKLNKKINKRK